MVAVVVEVTMANTFRAFMGTQGFAVPWREQVIGARVFPRLG